MRRRELGLIAGLLAIAVGGMVYGARTPGHGPKNQGPILQTTPASPHARPVKKNDKLPWGRNPFVFGSLSSESFAGLVLSGIFWDSVKPQAIIGDQIVGVGDRVGPNDTRVAEIRPDRVILNDGKNKVELTLS